MTTGARGFKALLFFLRALARAGWVMFKLCPALPRAMIVLRRRERLIAQGKAKLEEDRKDCATHPQGWASLSE